MKTQRTFRWFAVSLVIAMLFQFAITLPSASAQGEEPPTATQTPVEVTPTETETPIPTATAEGEGIEIPPAFEAPDVEEPLFQLFSLAQASTAIGDTLVAGGEASQSAPALAYNSRNQEYLTVWMNVDGGSSSIRGRLL